ncbi:EAL domain-containing protein [uncultured Desulfuromonas sp.]|uniref:putative bifunctional diguanylate cyclase/phosphodiesterase n=1 Tax=uncultured Desulfuromonas sp. TaxID=181013 RepID=UPI0026157440|nr:EAL domain-containing protein [uncultured Desulfuromonas sp.]
MISQDIHILLVEDSASQAEMIRQAVESCGTQPMRVSVATSLAQARSRLADSVPDLVIADLVLPDGRGTKLLPEDPDQAPYPVVILTGAGDEAEAVQAMRDGALDYVVKSENTLAELPAIVARTMGRWLLKLQDRRAREESRKDKEFLQAVIDGVQDPIMVIAPDFRVLLMNAAAAAHLPESTPSDGDLFCYQVSHHSQHPCHGEAHPCPLDTVRKSGEAARVIHHHFLGDGERRIFEVEASPLWNDDGTLRGVIESSRDITERLQVEALLEENDKWLQHLAFHDPLTGLPNRALLRDRLKQAMGKARRQERKVALLFLDLDRFKNINDSLGHPAGDRLLMKVAERLRGCVREADTVARQGGDEFLVVLEGVENAGGAAEVARKILRALAGEFVLEGHKLFITTSIGISLFPDDGESLDALLKNSDIAMYHAKAQGRNTYQFYAPTLNVRTEESLVMEASLRAGLEEDQFLLHYQPQHDLETGAIVGVEALLRWEHPTRGLVPPGDFIPLAEETGLIVPLGEWVLERACSQARAWQDAGSPPVRMAVNISPRQFRGARFVERVERVLGQTGLDPELLELEITEGLLMEDVQGAIATLGALKAMGVHLSIDDFGTGYSSLSYLKRFPISKLKIDRSFVAEIAVNPDDAAIAASIIALARNLRLDVIAEGVETKEQVGVLLEKGCRQGQGFLFCRPLPAGEVAGLMTAEVAAGI